MSRSADGCDLGAIGGVPGPKGKEGASDDAPLTLKASADFLHSAISLFEKLPPLRKKREPKKPEKPEK